MTPSASPETDRRLTEGGAYYAREGSSELGLAFIAEFEQAISMLYVTSDQVRQIIESKDFTLLATHPIFSTRDFKAVPAKYRALIPEYVKGYVALNQFAA